MNMTTVQDAILRRKSQLAVLVLDQADLLEDFQVELSREFTAVEREYSASPVRMHKDAMPTARLAFFKTQLAKFTRELFRPRRHGRLRSLQTRFRVPREWVRLVPREIRASPRALLERVRALLLWCDPTSTRPARLGWLPSTCRRQRNLQIARRCRFAWLEYTSALEAWV